MPNGFKIVTYRTSANTAGTGGVCAMVAQNYKDTSHLLSPFVQGPAAESKEAALRLLLEKLEAMIGRRWTSSATANMYPMLWQNYLEN